MKGKNLLLTIIAFISYGLLNAQQIDPDQVKCYLKFDDNLNNSATSSTTFTQTVGDDISYQTGKFGNAGYFDNMAVVSSGINFNPVNNFSLVAWLNHEQLSSVVDAQTWVHQKDVDGQNPGRIHMEVLVEDYLGSFTDGMRCDDVTAITANTWYHCAIVKDAAAGKRYIYVNGVLVNEINGGTESNTGEIVIGSRKNENSYFVQKGLMDELLLTGEVLDAKDINYIMTNGVQAAMKTTHIQETKECTFSTYYKDGSICIFSKTAFENSKYTIYNMNGQCVTEGEINSETNSVSIPLELNNGMYIISVTNGQNISSSKFIKQ